MNAERKHPLECPGKTAGLTGVAALLLLTLSAPAPIRAEAEVPAQPQLAEAPCWQPPLLIWIPPGSFLMGSPEDELGRLDQETLHEVVLTRGFFMGRTEVTQRQWRSVMGGNPSYYQGCEDCPVEQVSWFDAATYCNALSLLEGREAAYGLGAESVSWRPETDGYRLPTEAEWEYACRAGTTTAFYNGGITELGCAPLDPGLDAIGWYCGNDNWRTEQCAQKLPNAWALFDMSGNVWEWCWDWFEAEYPPGPVHDPAGPSAGWRRVTRGGSWYRYAERCRSANRDFHPPSDQNRILGFRVARSES